MKACLMVALTVVCVQGAVAMTTAEQICHRREVRAAVENTATRADALEKALKDEDPNVRRYAIINRFRDLKDDTAAVERLGRRFLDDPSPDVRILAKRLCRKGGLYRVNEPLSKSPFNDHATKRIQQAKATGKTFRFAEPLAAADFAAIEIWFGKPTCDLYVWVNDRYLGQFDSDLDRKQEFRLDATKETKTSGENTIAIRDANGKDLDVPYEVHALKW